MRAAVLTTGLVLAALVVWASLREAQRGELAATPPALVAAAEPALPDVASPPSPASVAAEAADAPDAPAIYRPATRGPAREHVVAEGETLADIALRYYGDAERAKDIYSANRDRIRDPAQIHAGQTLVIP